ncbi:MAG: DegT/DnrJ/EryC1/StrS family aminotransferase [Pseudomonadota bacterium]
MIRFLDLPGQYQSLRPEIDTAIQSVIETGAFIGGEGLKRFEQAFAEYQAVEHCVGVANGTDALEIAFEGLGLAPGSEVIVPANSFVASSEAVTRAGLKVVFADIGERTYLLDPADVERRITDKTSAIVAVHLYGQPAPMEELIAIADRHGLKIIEDCAQAHGASIGGRTVGNFGSIGTFSFYPGKNLGAYGDAGAMVTNDAALAKHCRMIANHGRVEKYNHEFEGRNSRMDGLQAAVLSVKLTKLDDWIDARNAVARVYSRELEGVGDVVTPQVRPDVRHAYHLYVIRTSRRDALKKHLADASIQSGIHYPIALPRLRAYADHPQHEEAFVASEQAPTLLSLPIGEHMGEEDALQVVAAVRDFFRG